MDQQKKPLKKIKCPVCKTVLEECDDLKKKGLFPFCSEKCKMNDLYGWFTGEYTISRNLRPDDLLEEENSGSAGET